MKLSIFKNVNSKESQSPLNNLKGVLWATAGMGLFAFIYISGKLTGNQASALQIMWLRYIGGFLTICILLLLTSTPVSKLRTRQATVHAMRAAAGGFGGVAAVFAASNLPIASASAIGLLDGVFTIILGIVLLRERLSLRQVTAVSVCLLGASLVLVGKGLPLTWNLGFWLPAMVGLGGAMLVAAESILIKQLSRSEEALPVLFYVNLFGSLILAGPGISSWFEIPPTMIFLFLGLGPIAIFAQTCNIWAFRYTDAVVIGPIRYTWIVFGLLFGLLLFSEAPTRLSIAGALLVVVGGVWLATSRAPRAKTEFGTKSSQATHTKAAGTQST